MLTDKLQKIIDEAPKDEKGRPVLPKDIFDEYHRDLPKGIVSDDGRHSNGKGGVITPGKKGDPKTIANCTKAGRKSAEVNAKRRTWAESIDIFLKMTDKDGRTNQDKIVEAMAKRALDGCVGASEFLRDTVGEKPSDNLSLDVMTDGDKELIANLMKRLNDRPDATK